MTPPETVSNPVRWGIIGCGSIATHAICPALRWSSLASLHAVASRNEESARHKARELKAEIAYGSYDELLADPEIDAVYIGLPNGLHEEWTVKAAQAGKHVLCEKSLALNSAAARRMVEVCEDANVLLMEAFMYRHHPQWDVVRGVLSEGKIGEIVMLRAGLFGQLTDTSNHRWSAQLGGGALYDVTCYGVNAARMIFGREPISTVAMADNSTRDGVDRTSAALLDFGYGRTAVVTGSLATFNHQYCDIEGTRGRIRIRNPFIPGWDRVEVIVEVGMTRDVVEVPGANHYLHMLEHFSLCLRDRARQLRPAENGLANVLVCEAIEQAWLSGNLVEVPEV